MNLYLVKYLSLLHQIHLFVLCLVKSVKLMYLVQSCILFYFVVTFPSCCRLPHFLPCVFSLHCDCRLHPDCLHLFPLSLPIYRFSLPCLVASLFRPMCLTASVKSMFFLLELRTKFWNLLNLLHFWYYVNLFLVRVFFITLTCCLYGELTVPLFSVKTFFCTLFVESCFWDHTGLPSRDTVWSERCIKKQEKRGE